MDLRSLPEPELGIVGALSRGPRDEVEEKLAALWSEILGINKKLLTVDADFFESGGHSLKAALLAAKIHKTCHVNVPLTEIFTTPTIRGLAAYIKEAEADKYISIGKTKKKEYYALSSAQKRLYFLHRMDREGVAYNIPSISILEGEIHKDRLENIFIKLV
ncbi:MAG: hypothetical protein GY940_12825, partial [bacterium]|nr:hypothetical protein [bacterium]